MKSPENTHASIQNQLSPWDDLLPSSTSEKILLLPATTPLFFKHSSPEKQTPTTLPSLNDHLDTLSKLEEAGGEVYWNSQHDSFYDDNQGDYYRGMHEASYGKIFKQIAANKNLSKDFSSLSPIEQLFLLQSIEQINTYDLSKESTDYDGADTSYYAEDKKEVRNRLSSLDANKFSPFIRLKLSQTINNLPQETFEDYIESHPDNPDDAVDESDWYESEEYQKYMDELDREGIIQEQKRIEKYKKFSQEQAELHSEFPFAPTNRNLAKIAPGVVATTTFGDIPVSLITPSEKISLADYKADNQPRLTQEEIYLLTAAHSPETKDLISNELSLDLSSISLDSQIQLLKYMTEADSSRYENLRSTLQNTPSILRKKLAEAFLSADYGSDFGDSLLTIANSDHFSPDQIADILVSIDSCRSSIKGITDLYKDYDDGRFAEQYSHAANERLTDVLYAFRAIAEQGDAKADLDWIGQTNLSYKDAIEALQLESKSLATINGTISDLVSGKPDTFAEHCLPDKDLDHSYFHLYSPDHGHVLLYVRPEGASVFNSNYEYGKFRNRYDEERSHQAGVEASISFIVDPLDPQHLPDYQRPNYSTDPHAKNKVSALRLDREGRAPGAPANDPERSPINPIGMVSVDLAAVNDPHNTPSGKISRLISTGNRLREQSQGTDFSLNHNTRHFDQASYGTSEGFKALAEYVTKNMDALCALHPPDKSNPNLSYLGQKSLELRKRRNNSTPKNNPNGPVRTTILDNAA